MPTRVETKLGPAADRAAAVLRKRIARGEIAAGTLVPSVRRLAGDLSLDSKTVWRALKGLEREGLIAAEPGKGFRVLAGAQDPARGCPVAYVLGDRDVAAGGMQDALALAFQKAAAERGWSLLTLSCRGRALGAVLAELGSSRAAGVVTDSQDEDFIAELKAAGVPTVIVDMRGEEVGLDAVMQDGQSGGQLAVRHLLERGCRRVAWFGPLDTNAHTLDRLGGVTAALCAAGGGVPRDLVIEAGLESEGEKSLQAARRMLAGPKRPDGVVALWAYLAAPLRRAAEEAGVVIGGDVPMVGWCVEEAWEREYVPAFGGGPVPPAAVWSARTMAETALARLSERRANPGLAPLTVRVPTRLRFAEERRP